MQGQQEQRHAAEKMHRSEVGTIHLQDAFRNHQHKGGCLSISAPIFRSRALILILGYFLEYLIHFGILHMKDNARLKHTQEEEEWFWFHRKPLETEGKCRIFGGTSAHLRQSHVRHRKASVSLEGADGQTQGRFGVTIRKRF